MQHRENSSEKMMILLNLEITSIPSFCRVLEMPFYHLSHAGTRNVSKKVCIWTIPT